MCHENFENRFKNKSFISKYIFWYEFCIDKGDDPKCSILNSGKIVNFIQTFEPLVSFLYYSQPSL